MEVWQGVDYDALVSFCIFALYWLSNLIIVLLGKEITCGKLQWRKLKYVSIRHEL